MNVRVAHPVDAAAPSAAKAWMRALELTAPIAREPERTLPAMLDALVAAHGDAPALISDRETLSYRALAARANRYARWALAQGVANGEAVALMMPNRPEYLAAWLGITRVGGMVALINTNLSARALAHCIDVAAPRHAIVATELVGAWTTAMPHLARRPALWAHGAEAEGFARIDRTLRRYADGPLDAAERRAVTIDDTALLIYTSGTTGLPKAAKVSHARVLTWSLWFAGLMDARPDDRMYDCLPLYHSVGGVAATGALLVAGGAVVIAEKFSVGRFWDDVTRHDCTIIQYIGELCRYLVNAAPHPREGEHHVRLACGNGLRADVWEAFERRFRIPRILEFYAATEGNLSFYNVEGKPGAIGRVPPFLAHRSPAAIVRFDRAHGAPLRDARGLCIRCGTDEVGEAIGRIDPASAAGRFEGYSDAAASEQKILRDVFAPGDAWYRTGDLMRRDAQSYFYFVDRIGDTFRWKGENVATIEVADAIARCPGIRDICVYGVAVPSHDGRAGMAALAVDETFDLATLHRHVATSLPRYARPLFLRIRAGLETTATFKHKKDELIAEGYDPATVADAIYVDDSSHYARIDKPLFERIQAGQMRL
ncbi:MAG TPA: long-chain-acyl-CoA synthetase [Xanthobacteraceae bacterium]|nr:long-chain-acyl-CoA synthetase [Xanthobacteraceae bacterium]